MIKNNFCESNHLQLKLTLKGFKLVDFINISQLFVCEK